MPSAQPRSIPAPRPAEAPRPTNPDPKIDGWYGDVQLGASMLSEVQASPMLALRAGAAYWISNVALTASVMGATGTGNSKASLGGGDAGVRFLAATGGSGIFAGGSVGFMAYGIEHAGHEGFRGDATTAVVHAEVGAIVRRVGLASFRATVPLSRIDGEKDELVASAVGSEDLVKATKTSAYPIAFSATFGFMF